MMRYFWLGLTLFVTACEPTSPSKPIDGQGGSAGEGGTSNNGGAGGSGGGTAGMGGTGGTTTNTNFEWQKQDIPRPSRRSASAMAYDEGRNVLVLYGGLGCVDDVCSTTVELEDLWEWDGSSWKNIPKANPWPMPLERHAMAYDPTRGQVIVNGGASGYWGWNGSVWTEIVTYCNLGCPASRKDHAMAFHKGRGHLVSYSGIGTALNDVSISVRTDSFELIGDFWTPIDTVQHPDGRVGAQLAYDPDNAAMWLFGGTSEYSSAFDGYPNDVWKLDKDGWTRVHAGGDPSDTIPWGRRQAAFLWHPGIKKAVLLGGFSYPAEQLVGGLETYPAIGHWTWDGVAWQKHPEWYLQESFRSDQVAGYHPKTNKIVQFSGKSITDFPTDTMYLFGPP